MRWFADSRSLVQGVSGRQRKRPWAHPLCSLVVALLGFAGFSAALAQTDTSPATGHAQVIAHGIVAMPGDALNWRVVSQRALAAATVSVETGFLLADVGNLVVIEPAPGEAYKLAPGMALLTRDGDQQELLSAGMEAAAYYAFELTPMVDPSADEAGTLRYVSDAFPRPESGVGIALIRDVLGDGEATVLPARAAPTVVLATAGTVEVANGPGASVALAAGEAIALTGTLTVTTSDDSATIVAATIESDQPTLPGRTAPGPGDDGSIEVVARECPAGYGGGAEDVPDGFAASCPEPLPGVRFTLSGSDGEIVVETDGEGRFRIDGVAPGDYLLTSDLPDDGVRYLVFCRNATLGGEATTGQNRFDILMTPGAQVSCEWYVVPGMDGAAQLGAIAVQGRLCPGPAAPAEACSSTDEIFAGNLLLSGPGDTRLSFANGQSHAVSHVWEGIPYGTYYFTMIDLADPAGYRLERIDGATVVEVGVEAIVVDAATPQVSIDFVYVPIADETGADNGTLMLSVYACPEATSPLAECAVRFVDGEIAIEGPDGIWLDRDNSDVSQRGDRRWEGLPAGTYNLAANLLMVAEPEYAIARVDGATDYFEGVASVVIDATSPDVALAVVFAPGGPVAGD